MLNKTLIFGKSEPKAGFVWLFVLVATLLFLQCSGEDPGNIVGPPYTPPELTNTTWEMVANPESVGWSSAKLQNAYEFAQNTQTAAMMIVYQGKVLYHWGDLTRKFWVHSCRKSFMSALYGIHVSAGHIDLSKTMAELGIDDSTLWRKRKRMRLSVRKVNGNGSSTRLAGARVNSPAPNAPAPSYRR